MKKIILLGLFFAGSLYTQAQSLDTILYILPDNVEVILNKRIGEKEKDDANSKIYFYLNRYEGNYRLNMNEVTSNLDSLDRHFLKNTRRFVLINKQKYPLILDYDMSFALLKPNEKIGDFGSRFNGYIRGRKVIMEGYNLSFNGSGEIIKEDWGIFDGKSNASDILLSE